MPKDSTPTAPQSSWLAQNLPLGLGLLVVVFFFVVSGAVSYRQTRFLLDGARLVTQTHEVINTLNVVRSLLQDAETGQRGYLLTGDEKYLEPYAQARAGFEAHLGRLAAMIEGSAGQRALLASARTHIAAKLAELDETIELRRTRGLEAALAVVNTNRGKAEMDALRNDIAEMAALTGVLRAERLTAMQDSYRSAVTSGVLTALLGVVLSIIIAVMVHRATLVRRHQAWLQSGGLGLNAALFGDLPTDQLGENILRFLTQYLGAQAGAFFVRDGTDFQRVATMGVPAQSETPQRFGPGDGLLGQAAGQKEPLLLNDVPEGYLAIGSGLGQGRPRHLVIAPATADHKVNAVFELGFLQPPTGPALELLQQVAEPIGVAVKSAHYRSNLQGLLTETQRQAEELQAQSEELRVSNEELEEQSRALRESQARLEQQQVELEQSNAQLEEQAQMLEAQRDDLERAQTSVQAKADELERASRYKSDFLANMSHELRTPLNSSLILSKILADNAGGNLTPEQVKHAQTIQSSGNDLLSLINDILDLSKIEAGHMEVNPEPVPVARLAADLGRVFEPIAKERKVTFTTRLSDDCPVTLETDRQRLEQILRNLLSNAFKFTEKGGVELTVSPTPEGGLAFAVQDTGIGIPAEHQATIFEAFRQADGTISRRYGGTGLGLSISLELARLLGGTIQLRSVAGQGSTFALLLPARYEPGAQPPAEAPLPPARMPEAASPSNAPPPPVRRAFLPDDREKLAADSRVILVVEDDESFARILLDLAHECGFLCLLAATAEDALAIARQYLPHAVILDVGLPDNSGLSVLDRLKRDTRTRHIPIHVVSASDYSQTALSLGAIGYLIKPVKREDLLQALRQIEARVSDEQRNVLIVEDDAVQRESLVALLGSTGVRTVAVGTAAECLQKLRETTFDCMVLDLSLPDASGFALLETLSNEEAYAFPPVIVYTGRELSREEELKLRRYSKSIIIKGAKSPERLLDEVTLFLHRVVAALPAEQQRLLERAQNRDAILEGRCILVVEDDVRNVYSLTNILEPRGARVEIARNGREALDALEKSSSQNGERIDLVLMDVMMPEMDGLTATQEIRRRPEWKKLPVIMLTAKAMKNDQQRCLEAGANDYMAKPLDVEKLLSLVRVWMPRL